MSNESNTDWFKATASGGNGGNCVELRRQAGTVEIRDTKQNGKGPTLTFACTEFAAWINGAKNGEFDHLG
jgi:hypothetical protein